MASGIIGLVTDFGLADSWVGQMKAVMLGVAREVRVVDITHEVPAFDLAAGAWHLLAAAEAFGDGSVLVGVVDPGVGTARRAVAIRTRRRFLVGPDNGLLTPLAEREGVEQAVELCPERLGDRAVSGTFHGRDIFAPAAAWLAVGRGLEEIGRPIEGLAPGPWKPAVRRGEAVEAEVIWIDRFGNAVLNVGQAELDGLGVGVGRKLRVEVGGREIVGLGRTYGDVEPGEPMCYMGSSGWLEIGVREDSAAAKLGLARGRKVRLGAQG